MGANITPEALERAQVAYSRALTGPGSHVRGLEAAILAALPELLAAQPASTAGGQEPVATCRCGAPCRKVILERGGDNGWGDDDSRTVLRYAAPVAGEAAELSPEFTDTARAAIAWVLWHHQGGSSAVGQPLRYALGMGDHDPLNDRQIAEAKRYATLVGAKTEDFRQPAPAAVPVDASIDVRRILISVIPDDEGMGHEVYAKSVADVEAEFERMSLRIDELEHASQPGAQGVDLGQLRQLRDQFLSWSNSCSASDNAAAAFEQAAETLGELIDSQHQQKEPTHG